VTASVETRFELITQASEKPGKEERCRKMSVSGGASPLVPVIFRLRPVLCSEEEAIARHIPAASRASSYDVEGERVCVFISSSSRRVVCEGREFALQHDAIGPEVLDPSTLLLAHRASTTTTTWIAYGSTGSGKTHSCKQLVDRAGMDHFLCPQPLALYVSCYELCFGDKLRDLLSLEGDSSSLSVREDENGGVHVVGITETRISDYEHFSAVLAAAFLARATCSTESNNHSSRSHAFFQLRVEEEDAGDIKERILRVVDLAGNERVENTAQHDSTRLQELKHINYSLSCLKDCLRSSYSMLQSTSSLPFVPFRRSKLTLILRDAIRTQSFQFVAHLSPLLSQIKHTRNTLTFVESILDPTSRAEEEAKNFVGPLLWSPKEMQSFVASLDVPPSLAEVFAVSGKLFSCEWIGHVVRRVEAAGGSETDAHVIYDAFHLILKKHKQQKHKGGSTSKNGTSRFGIEAKKAFADKFIIGAVAVASTASSASDTTALDGKM